VLIGVFGSTRRTPFEPEESAGALLSTALVCIRDGDGKDAHLGVIWPVSAALRWVAIEEEDENDEEAVWLLNALVSE